MQSERTRYGNKESLGKNILKIMGGRNTSYKVFLAGTNEFASIGKDG